MSRVDLWLTCGLMALNGGALADEMSSTGLRPEAVLPAPILLQQTGADVGRLYLVAGSILSGNNPVLTKVIQDMRTSFGHFAAQGKLAALIYYDWTAGPGAKDTFSVFRCGGLTELGKLAISPM